MGEAEWLASTDPQAMLTFLRDNGRTSERKCRLFALGCCRRLWPLLTDTCCLRAVEVAEEAADGLARGEELRRSWEPVDAIMKELERDTFWGTHAGAAEVLHIKRASPGEFAVAVAWWASL